MENAEETMSIRDRIEKRFLELLEEGERLRTLLTVIRTNHFDDYVDRSRIEQYQQWIASVENLIHTITLPSSHFRGAIDRLYQGSAKQQYGLPTRLFQGVFGLLKAAKQEWDRGLLRTIEYIVVASTFDDFLDHAEGYHKGNKKVEASVLASAVLEDTVKKIAVKNGYDPSGQSLEDIINELVNINIFSSVKAKRVRVYAGVRNHAFHAEWDEFDIKDVGKLIEGVRELLENYL